MKQARTYALSQELIDEYGKLPVSRSSAVTMAINEATQDPTAVVKALSRRLSESEKTLSNDRETIKVSVSLDPPIIKMVQELADRFRLPTEHTLRLAMEAYIYKL